MPFGRKRESKLPSSGRPLSVVVPESSWSLRRPLHAVAGTLLSRDNGRESKSTDSRRFHPKQTLRVSIGGRAERCERCNHGGHANHDWFSEHSEHSRHRENSGHRSHSGLGEKRSGQFGGAPLTPPSPARQTDLFDVRAHCETASMSPPPPPPLDSASPASRHPFLTIQLSDPDTLVQDCLLDRDLPYCAANPPILDPPSPLDTLHDSCFFSARNSSRSSRDSSPTRHYMERFSVELSKEASDRTIRSHPAGEQVTRKVAVGKGVYIFDPVGENTTLSPEESFTPFGDIANQRQFVLAGPAIHS